MTELKSDMGRIGLFKEMGYTTIGDKYVPSYKFSFNEAAYKGKQMLTANSKTRVTALQDGYFSKHFARVFDKESYSDPIGTRRRKRVLESKRIIGKPFITFHGEKKPEGFGSNFGTFGGKTEYFSPKIVDNSKTKAEKPNFKVSPPKRGTGYGYSSVGIGKYPEYGHEKYDAAQILNKEIINAERKKVQGGPFKSGKFHDVFFEKNPFLSEKDGAVFREKKRSHSDSDVKPFIPSSPPKQMKDAKDGCFTDFPEHMDDPFKENMMYKPRQKIVNTSGKLFYPEQGPKSKPQVSTIHHNIKLKINKNNYKDSLNLMTYHLNALTV